MKTSITIALTLLALTLCSQAADSSPGVSAGGPIRHTVFFLLKHPPGSQAEREFFRAARPLAKIPGVQRFQRLREVSPKNKFTFGFSMEFADQAAYDAYNKHPDHVRFVEEIWKKEVEDFMEIDYVVIRPAGR